MPIKVNVKEVNNSKLFFPCLMSSKHNNDYQIILVTKEEGNYLEGTNINGVRSSIGYYSNRWNRNDFSVWNGQVTISSD